MSSPRRELDEKALRKLRARFRKMMGALFQEQGATLRIEILEDPAVQDFIGTHAGILDSAFQEERMPDSLRDRLRETDWMFSGYKAFHELNEAFPSLVDESGARKPFDRFLKDVQSIDETYNRNWLRAEYNFAGASAQMAAKWERYAEEGDDYYLQYRTANDGAVRPEHAALHGVTLPQSDTFWDTYYPPNGWNCRCTVVQVRRSKYEQTPHDEAMAKGAAALAKDTKGMFRFNPGKQKSAFPAYNPYTISKCRNCDKSQFRLADGRYVAGNDLCAACLFLQECKVKEHEFFIAGDGMIKVSRLVDPKGSDYKKLMEVAEFFAKGGATVELTPKMSRPAEFLYDCIYGDLRGTPYEGKCPDMRVDGVWYEHEGFTTEDPRNAFRNMMNHGLKQSSRIIIDQPGLTDAFMKKSIYRRIEKYGQAIDEVWVREPEGIRPLYKRSKD